MVGFGGGDDAFGFGELDAGGEAGGLVVGFGFDEAEFLHVADERGHAVVAEAAGVESWRGEGGAERVHFDERREVGGIAEVIGVGAAGEGGAGGGFDCDDAGFLASAESGTDEGEGDAGEVGSAAGATDDDIGVIIGHLELFDGFDADDGLVEQDVVEDGAQGVFGIFRLGGDFHGFRDGDTEAAGVVGALGEDGASGLGFLGWRGYAACAVGFHDGAAVGFLVEGDLDHEDLDIEAEDGAGEGEGGAPLAGAGFGDDAFDACFLIVEGLGDGGIGFVAASGADAFVFVVDAGGGIEGLLEASGTEEWGWAPLAVDIADGFRYFDFAFCGDFLLDQGHGEERGEVFGADGLLCTRVEHRGQGFGQVGRDVVPAFGDAGFVEEVFN